MSGKTILVWFRNDLHIHDNEILLEASKRADKIVPVYCFDPEYFGLTSISTQKTGAIRAKFIIESVSALKQDLQHLGGDLIVRFGKPEDVLPQIVQKYAVSEVYHHREVATEETETSALVEAALWKIRINLKHFIGHTMYHKEDLPFPIKDIPDVFSVFRKKIERESAVRPCLDTPESITVPEDLDKGSIPTLADLGLSGPECDDRSVIHFNGGETSGLKRLQYYFEEDKKVNRDSLAGSGYLSRLSPWISLGCLSPRKVYWEIKNNEQRLSKDVVNRLMIELLRRDYFRFMFKKHTARFSNAKEITSGSQTVNSLSDQHGFTAWKNAETGIPFVDAIMNELNATGYISYFGRQVVANYLIKNSETEWVYGAAYFEEKLIDYSPASNGGNWSYLAEAISNAAAGNDYDVLKQAINYDPDGDYVRKWVPSLALIPGALIHQPWKLSVAELENYGVKPLYSHSEAVADL